MLSRVLVLTLAAMLMAGGYVDVYVEDGPEVEGLHIYAWTGAEWRPVYVVYQPQHVDTYVVATGEWIAAPYYNMSRYVLRIPRETQRESPALPPGFERWILEVDNGTRRTVVTLAVGREPLKLNNLTTVTWQTFGDKEIKTPNKGRMKTPPGRQPRNGARGGEAGAASYAVSTGATIYPVGSLYFKPVAVAGTFSTYVPVDSPLGHRYICVNEMHWVGFEVQNFTVGVKVDGYVTGGYLTLEFYNLDTCSFITSVSLSLPSSGLYWTSVQPSLPADAQIGVRARVSGRAEAASINVYVAARYKKTVNNLAQVATSKAVSAVPPSINSDFGREKAAVLFGPYVAYDGMAATSAGMTYSYIYVPPSTVKLQWSGSYCPSLFVEYYVNGVYYTSRLVGPSTPSPAGYYCYYDVPSTVLQIRAREYAVSKAISGGGGIAVAVVYTTLGTSATISYGGRLEIVYDRWIEPFHSQYINPTTGAPYAHWSSMLLLNTFQALGPVNNTRINMVTEVRASNNEIVLSLQHNGLNTLCGAEWRLTGPQVGGPVLYYGNEWVQEPWWAALGKHVLDAVDWLSLVTGSKSPVWTSLLLKIIQNVFQTASGQVFVSTSGGDVVVTWTRGWLETTPPPAVVVSLRPTGGTTYTVWRTFAVAQFVLSECYTGLGFGVNTNMYLPPRAYSGGLITEAKIWTWRGQTYVGTGLMSAS